MMMFLLMGSPFAWGSTTYNGFTVDTPETICGKRDRGLQVVMDKVVKFQIVY